MPDFAEPLARLISEFKHLPGIGPKSAQRLAFHLLRCSRDDAQHLAQAILDVKDKLGLCQVCNNISDGDICQFCRDPNRDARFICVVEEPHNILGIETTRQFSGV
jgi:recombination protein RecR